MSFKVDFFIKDSLNPRSLFIDFSCYFTKEYKVVFYPKDKPEDNFVLNLFSLDGVDKVSFFNNRVILSKSDKSIYWDKSLICEIVEKHFSELDLSFSKLEIKDNILDLTKFHCPFSYIKLLYHLKSLNKGEEIEVFLSSEKSFLNIVSSLDKSCYKITKKLLMKEKEIFFFKILTL